MIIHFIMGPTHSGKSTFIEGEPELSDAIVIDTLDIQAYCRKQTEDWTREKLWHFSALALRGTILKYKKNGKDVVIAMEMTGLTRAERKTYIDFIVPVLDDPDKIVGWWLFSTPEDLAERLRNDSCDDADAFVERQLADAEAPSLGEGFTDLHAVYTQGVLDPDEQVVQQAAMHLGYVGKDPDRARDLLRKWGEGELPSFYYPKAGDYAKQLRAKLLENEELA